MIEEGWMAKEYIPTTCIEECRKDGQTLVLNAAHVRLDPQLGANIRPATPIQNERLSFVSSINLQCLRLVVLMIRLPVHVTPVALLPSADMGSYIRWNAVDRH